jgi:hypothetical protein
MNAIVYLALMFLVALLIGYGCERRKRAVMEERFPPISDAEFVARCSPGTDPAVALKVRRILADCLCVEYDRIYPSARLVEDLGAE